MKHYLMLMETKQMYKTRIAFDDDDVDGNTACLSCLLGYELRLNNAGDEKWREKKRKKRWKAKHGGVAMRCLRIEGNSYARAVEPHSQWEIFKFSWHNLIGWSVLFLLRERGISFSEYAVRRRKINILEESEKAGSSRIHWTFSLSLTLSISLFLLLSLDLSTLPPSNNHPAAFAKSYCV